ncbi:MAG: sugar phosphate isomerase/epimerase [Planctomycetaceae bacterium]|nr:sugar phosphate isomerase/epimerase [Planctomycetaceae bacterium]
MQYVLFTDNLADLSIADALAGAKRAGFDGIDLTLRPGGHVLPEHAEMGLAEASAAARRGGLTIPMISTAVSAGDSPHAEAIFAAAAHYGARHVKLGYWDYQPFGTLAQQVDRARAQLAQVVELGKKYQVLPCVHCHSGRFVASGGPLLYLVLKDFPPGEVGAYVDPMHMTIEGSRSGWELGLDLLAPWIALVGVKNFRWLPAERDASGQQRYRWEYVPLADGQAPLPEFVGYLKQLRYDGVVSLHSEYKGGSSFRRLTTPELLAQSAADLAYLKKLFG